MSYPHFVPKEKKRKFCHILNDILAVLTFCQTDMAEWKEIVPPAKIRKKF